MLAALTLLFVVALLLCHPLVDDKEKALYYGMLRIWVYMLMTPAAYACGGAMLACKLSVFPIYLFINPAYGIRRCLLFLCIARWRCILSPLLRSCP